MYICKCKVCQFFISIYYIFYKIPFVFNDYFLTYTRNIIVRACFILQYEIFLILFFIKEYIHNNPFNFKVISSTKFSTFPQSRESNPSLNKALSAIFCIWFKRLRKSSLSISTLLIAYLLSTR